MELLSERTGGTNSWLCGENDHFSRNSEIASERPLPYVTQGFLALKTSIHNTERSQRPQRQRVLQKLTKQTKVYLRANLQTDSGLTFISPVKTFRLGEPSVSGKWDWATGRLDETINT
jgi:hypothetical protein